MDRVPASEAGCGSSSLPGDANKKQQGAAFFIGGQILKKDLPGPPLVPRIKTSFDARDSFRSCPVQESRFARFLPGDANKKTTGDGGL
jgi:hypothetical protein